MIIRLGFRHVVAVAVVLVLWAIWIHHATSCGRLGDACFLRP